MIPTSLPLNPSQNRSVETKNQMASHKIISLFSLEELAEWNRDMETRLAQIVSNPENNLGHIEEAIRQGSLELQRKAVERAMQAKADAVDEKCHCCQTPLIDKKRRVPKTIRSHCGQVILYRSSGWCENCDHWVYPADKALGLSENSTASPLVQEMCALLVSKMPAAQAELVIARLTGVAISRSTLAREAQRQGDRAIQKREEQIKWPTPLPIPKPSIGLDQPLIPFTLVIQMDAWNIRERDNWGETEAIKKRGGDLNRWHWVYTGTCFRLNQRCIKGKNRAMITERSYVATRQGIEPMIQQLHAEAMRRGLGQAERVLVIADGAVWIWNAAKDRFSEAVQRLDLFHANSYLWAVANQLFGENKLEARRWIKPLLRQLRKDKVARVIESLNELIPQLTEPQANATKKAVEYFGNNKERMKYAEGEERGEPLGSGAIESTCRQLQCRMKRCGQFWSTAGDESILCLEMFWRNDRWDQLFPHVALTSAQNN